MLAKFFGMNLRLKHVSKHKNMYNAYIQVYENYYEVILCIKKHYL
jgi:hypothetical protein